MNLWPPTPQKGPPLSNFQPHPFPSAPPQRKGFSGLVVFGIGITAFLFGGFLANGSSGGDSSELDAANERVSQLEAQLAAKGTPAPTGAPASAAATQAVQPPSVTLSGDGEMKSKKVRMEGDYSVKWKTMGSCYYSADLENGGNRGESVFTASDRPHSGTGNVYGLAAAEYHLDVITGPAPGCGWSVTLTPLP